jgi:hypothetical protein
MKRSASYGHHRSMVPTSFDVTKDGEQTAYQKTVGPFHEGRNYFQSESYPSHVGYRTGVVGFRANTYDVRL